MSTDELRISYGREFDELTDFVMRDACALRQQITNLMTTVHPLDRPNGIEVVVPSGFSAAVVDGSLFGGLPVVRGDVKSATARVVAAGVSGDTEETE